MMGIKEQMQELEEKVIKGLEMAYERMAAFKKQKNSPLIVSKDGKIIEIEPEEIMPSIRYKP